jgi:hypothetical protein
MPKKNPHAEARRKLLADWLEANFPPGPDGKGSQRAFIDHAAKRGHVVNQGELSAILSGKKSFAETKARTYELAGGMPEGTLSPDAQRQPQPVKATKAEKQGELDIVALQVMVNGLVNALISSTPTAARHFRENVEKQIAAIRREKYPWFSELQGVVAPALGNARRVQEALEGADQQQSRRGSGR